MKKWPYPVFQKVVKFDSSLCLEIYIIICRIKKTLNFQIFGSMGKGTCCWQNQIQMWKAHSMDMYIPHGKVHLYWAYLYLLHHATRKVRFAFYWTNVLFCLCNKLLFRKMISIINLSFSPFQLVIERTFLCSTRFIVWV